MSRNFKCGDSEMQNHRRLNPLGVLNSGCSREVLEVGVSPPEQVRLPVHGGPRRYPHQRLQDLARQGPGFSHLSHPSSPGA